VALAPGPLEFFACKHFSFLVKSLSEMSTDQDWIRTEANFAWIRTGSDRNFF